jgi:predicted acetyltransferase
MNIQVTPAQVVERPILRRMMELYQYDFTEFDGTELGPLGLDDYPYLDHYWVEPERSPFLVRVEGNLAGFVLVARYNYPTGCKDSWVMAEFFILRKYRHQGIGESGARIIFGQFPGPWQVAQINVNLPAITFWHKVIDRYTLGGYQEHKLDNDHWHGLVQIFNSPPVAAREYQHSSSPISGIPAKH